MIGKKKLEPKPIEEAILKRILAQTRLFGNTISKAIDKLVKAANNLSSGLYEANKEVYHLLRYGVTVRRRIGATQRNRLAHRLERCGEQSVWRGRRGYGARETYQTPDVVIYVNGIALGV